MYAPLLGALLMIAFRFPGLDIAPESGGGPPPRVVESAPVRIGPEADRAIGWIRDSWVTAQIELRLMTNRDVNVTQIHVQTRDGVVTLEGAVPSQDARSAAQDDARRVDGVRTVVNHLRIASEAGAPPRDTRTGPAAPSSGSL
jgi:hyperosmotically inducible periplasmic protein